MSQTKKGRLHFAFLDGLRGFAAIYVLLFHVIADGRETLEEGDLVTNLLSFGHEAVVIFIVLSGFLLALPVASSTTPQLSGGLERFFKRRAKRILPAYYPALFMLPLFFLGIELLKQISGEGADWEFLRETFFSADMLSHIFLLHNLSEEWSLSINPVLWSLSTEWWIYFIYALVLIPIWRRFGIISATIFSVFLGLVPIGLNQMGLPGLAGYPYLLGAFGLGMVSGAALLSNNPFFRSKFGNQLLIGISGVACISLIWIIILHPSIRLSTNTRWITDLLIAVICAIFIFRLALAQVDKEKKSVFTNLPIRILGMRPLIEIGKFSYSLYLTHLVIWAMIGITLNLEPIKQFINISLEPMPVRIFFLIPALIISAYCFYLVFEKPFLQTPPKTPGTSLNIYTTRQN